MKLASFETDESDGYGVVVGDAIIPLENDSGAMKDLKSYLALFAAEKAPRVPEQPRIPLNSIRLLPPIPDPSKIFCVATNFHEPSREGKPLPEYPPLFTRFGDSLTGHEAPILKPCPSDRFDFEGEVAVVIGKPGYQIPEETAMSHVVGYSCFNDGTARDWQKHSTQFTPGKNFYRSGSFGPWLVTVDEIPDPTRLTLETRVNGITKQSITLDRFIFSIPWLIAYISTFSPLKPGDVIVTGTPWGFGSSREPPEFLGLGDVVEVEVSSIGILRNTVVKGPSK